MKVFISYSHEDKDITNRIVRELETAGHHIWLDSWRIELGDNIFEKKLKRALITRMPSSSSSVKIL